MAFELFVSVGDINGFGDRHELVCPIDRRIAAAGNDHGFPFKSLERFDGIMQIRHLKCFRPFDVQLFRFDDAASDCYNDRFGPMLRS